MNASDTAPSILLVKLSAIGDCVCSVPVLMALREAYPTAKIGWATQAGPHTLLREHPMVDCFHVYPRDAFNRKKRGSFLGGLAQFKAFRQELRNEKYDVAIDLQGLTKSGLVAWWSNAPMRIGFGGEDSRELNWAFINRRVAVPELAVHVVEKNLSLMEPLGIRPTPPQGPWAMPRYASERKEMDLFLNACGIPFEGLEKEEDRRRAIVVNPGATWETKRWPVERFGELARWLVQERRETVVVTWAGEAEQQAANAIVLRAGHTGAGKAGAFVAPPTNLRQLAALTARAKLFIGNDTGPLHLAAALNVPCVSVFGASDSKRNGPYGDAHRVEVGEVECQPCWKTTCMRKDLACLMGITVERMRSTCERVLNRIKDQGA